MSAKTIQSLVQSWETVRFELLNTRISRLKLTVEGKSYSEPVEVKLDPRVKISPNDLEKQLATSSPRLRDCHRERS